MIRPALLAFTSLALLIPVSSDAQSRYQTRYAYSQTESRDSRRFDGFCYVREDSVRADAETDYWGTRQGYGRCYRGEYYAYTDTQVRAPRAPAGYVVRYFSRRPDRAFFDRVYNASTLTENFGPDAEYRGNVRRDSQDDRRYADGYADDSHRRYERRDEDARYRDADDYARAYDEYPAEETRPQPAPAPRATPLARDADDYDDDQATVGRYETSAPSDDYARDSHRPDQNGYVAPYDARAAQQTLGWQDDQGAWHTGRPAAVGWKDEYGQWHEGEVQAYGWRDRDGQWHETADDAQ